jgi:hypothetical protein
MGREMAMRDLFAPLVDAYDFIVLDCLPGLGLLAINALTASDAVLIPVQADYLALQGVAQVLDTIGAVRSKLNPRLEVLGTLLTMMDVRTAHARGVAELLRTALDGQVRVFDMEIRTQVALKDSAQHGMPVLNFRPDSQAAAAYRELAAEVLAYFSLPTAEPGAVQPVAFEAEPPVVEASEPPEAADVDVSPNTWPELVVEEAEPVATAPESMIFYPDDAWVTVAASPEEAPIASDPWAAIGMSVAPNVAAIEEQVTAEAVEIPAVETVPEPPSFAPTPLASFSGFVADHPEWLGGRRTAQ